MGGDKKRAGGLVISRGILSGLPLSIQRGGDPFCGYERSECKIIRFASPLYFGRHDQSAEALFVGAHIFSGRKAIGIANFKWLNSQLGLEAFA